MGFHFQNSRKKNLPAEPLLGGCFETVFKDWIPLKKVSLLCCPARDVIIYFLPNQNHSQMIRKPEHFEGCSQRGMKKGSTFSVSVASFQALNSGAQKKFISLYTELISCTLLYGYLFVILLQNEVNQSTLTNLLRILTCQLETQYWKESEKPDGLPFIDEDQTQDPKPVSDRA